MITIVRVPLWGASADSLRADFSNNDNTNISNNNDKHNNNNNNDDHNNDNDNNE